MNSRNGQPRRTPDRGQGEEEAEASFGGIAGSCCSSAFRRFSLPFITDLSRRVFMCRNRAS